MLSSQKLTFLEELGEFDGCQGIERGLENVYG
jgi:hypothetical protein